MPKCASVDNKRNVANPSSRFPINGIASGMNSKIPNPGFIKYNPDIVPITPTMIDFILTIDFQNKSY